MLGEALNRLELVENRLLGGQRESQMPVFAHCVRVYTTVIDVGSTKCTWALLIERDVNPKRMSEAFSYRGGLREQQIFEYAKRSHVCY